MSAQRWPRALLAAVAVALLASVAVAAGADVTLTRRPDDAYEISGLFSVDASTAVVWDVLTDYAGIPRFVSSMRASRVRETRADGSALVAQEAVGGAFFFSKTMRVLLDVRRSSDALRFTDVGHEDFSSYDGSWEVRTLAVGAEVTYHLVAVPRFRAPSFILGRAMKSGARDLLDQVRAEIARRRLPR